MTVLNLQIVAGPDDAEELEANGVVYPGLDWVAVVSDAVPANRLWGGFRWVYGSLSKGDLINSCVLQVYIADATYDDANFDLYFQRVADPATFSASGYDISGRSRTTASVPWVADSLGTGWVSADDIKDVLQEVVDDFDPNAFAVILKPRTDMAKALVCHSYDFDPALAAKMDIDYTARSISYPTASIAAGRSKEVVGAQASIAGTVPEARASGPKRPGEVSAKKSSQVSPAGGRRQQEL